MAWLRGGFRIISAGKALKLFADTDCDACIVEVSWLRDHPDDKAIVIGQHHIALTGHFRSFWRFFWEVKK